MTTEQQIEDNVQLEKRIADRAHLLMYLDFHAGLITYQRDAFGVDVFYASNELARAFVITSDNEIPYVCVDEEMRALVEAPWAGWRPVDGHLALIGEAPGRPATFELRIPLAETVMRRFEDWQGPLRLAWLDYAYGDDQTAETRGEVDLKRLALKPNPETLQ